MMVLPFDAMVEIDQMRLLPLASLALKVAVRSLAGERIARQVVQKRLDAAQHTAVQQAAVQVAGQQHPIAGLAEGQQGRLQQAAGPVDPEPAVLRPEQLSGEGLRLSHRPCGLQWSAEAGQFRQIPAARRLAQQLEAVKGGGSEEHELLKRYRQREEKRLRELVHEANNPLSVVHNYLHILELRLQHEPTATEQLQLIGSELKRAGEIIQGARELSPVAELESQADVVIEPFDVSELARRVHELHRGYAADHDVETALELPPGRVQIISDEHRLAQVLNNLMRNAIEASSGESVQIGVAVGLFREGREGIEVFVRDTGPGLPRSVLERLADPKESTKGGDHAGLGLHIVHRLVMELHGSMDVRTAAGRGTTFSLFLPLVPR